MPSELQQLYNHTSSFTSSHVLHRGAACAALSAQTVTAGPRILFSIYILELSPARPGLRAKRQRCTPLSLLGAPLLRANGARKELPMAVPPPQKHRGAGPGAGSFPGAQMLPWGCQLWALGPPNHGLQVFACALAGPCGCSKWQAKGFPREGDHQGATPSQVGDYETAAAAITERRSNNRASSAARSYATCSQRTL